VEAVASPPSGSKLIVLNFRSIASDPKVAYGHALFGFRKDSAQHRAGAVLLEWIVVCIKTHRIQGDVAHRTSGENFCAVGQFGNAGENPTVERYNDAKSTSTHADPVYWNVTDCDAADKVLLPRVMLNAPVALDVLTSLTISPRVGDAKNK
jgi:hypothetical protein